MINFISFLPSHPFCSAPISIIICLSQISQSDEYECRYDAGVEDVLFLAFKFLWKSVYCRPKRKNKKENEKKMEK